MRYLLLLLSFSVNAEVYRYKDINGRVYLTSSAAIANHPFTKQDIDDVIHQTALKHNVPEKLIQAVVQTESAYQYKAISSAGAVGLMQLMPAAASRFGVHDRTDVKQNIEGGTKYLKWLLSKFKDTRLAVAGYNAGEGAVLKYSTIPPYPETQDYVKKVIGHYGK